MWVGAFRQFDHSSQETNSAIEGYHTSIKATFSTDKVLLRGRRLDWLVFMLTKKVLATARDRAVSKLCGFQPNTKQEKATIQAVREVSSFTPATFTSHEVSCQSNATRGLFGKQKYKFAGSQRHCEAAANCLVQLWQMACTCRSCFFNGHHI